MKGHCTDGRPLSSVQDRGATFELWPPTRSRNSCGTLASPTALAISREVVNTRACCARAPCRAGCDRTTDDKISLHRREVSLLRCKTVVRRASCGLQHAAGFRGTHRHCAGCLSRSDKTRELAARARRAALPVIGFCAMKGYCTGGRPLSFGARPGCVVRAVTSNVQPAFAWHACMRVFCGRSSPSAKSTRAFRSRQRRTMPWK